MLSPTIIFEFLLLLIETEKFSEGDFTFSDAVLEIQDATHAHTYFSATLGNVEFIEQSGVYYLLNPNLDGDDPDTLNLSNIDLSVNALFPSLYIEQLGSALEIQGISGMKMTLRSFGGDFANYSSGFIVTYITELVV